MDMSMGGMARLNVDDILSVIFSYLPWIYVRNVMGFVCMDWLPIVRRVGHHIYLRLPASESTHYMTKVDARMRHDAMVMTACIWPNMLFHCPNLQERLHFDMLLSNLAILDRSANIVWEDTRTTYAIEWVEAEDAYQKAGWKISDDEPIMYEEWEYLFEEEREEEANRVMAGEDRICEDD
jgi:hypothetical protein